MKNIFVSFLIISILASCSPDSNNNEVATTENHSDTSDFSYFEFISSKSTGIDFRNDIVENAEHNIFFNDAIYQGSGVGVLDINNDGLMDLYFGGTQVTDRLYLNKGNLQFEDITDKSKTILENKDCTGGVAIVDINGDGLDDIYVSKFLYDERAKRKNQLYINNGNLSFSEQSEQFGLDDFGHSIHASFFDYDKDGDLDVYICNQPPSSMDEKKKASKSKSKKYTDRLFRNDNMKFVEVTESAGITNFSYSLSASICDVNNDGWLDVYVASDYEEPDYLYINNKNGTFSNTIHSAMKHLSTFSMGSDVADINNDGFLDIYTVDMVAEDNYRQKTNMSGMNPEKFWKLVNNGYHHQYMFNALQINNGNGTFSEIAQMAGISNTDWSWAPLFMDIDNDGFQDILVSNGLYKDVRNKDFDKTSVKYVKSKKGELSLTELLELTTQSPSVPIQNYIFRNNGELGFDKKSDQWGFKEKGWSQGMIYADLDNDGDLDLVMNNSNDVAWLYKNKSVEHGRLNYLNIVLKGSKDNKSAFGSRITVTTPDHSQILDHSPYRGYMSSSQSIAHFGLDKFKEAEVSVVFPNGKMWTGKVEANQTKEINWADAQFENAKSKSFVSSMFTEIKKESNIHHQENTFDDYTDEILIPYKLSSLGPTLAVADVNSDGYDDFYLGGSVGISGQLYLGSKNGFRSKESKSFEAFKAMEDGKAEFVDIDNDGDLDLYVTSGGNEYRAEKNGLIDRFYFNDGAGGFDNGIPMKEVDISSGSVCFIDFDSDGDKDIFVGGRQVPGKYGISPNSQLYENTPNGFFNVSNTKAKIFEGLGMITGAVANDWDGDGKEELITVGEWMPLKRFQFDGTEFKEVKTVSFDDSNGLWSSLKLVDLDGDGNKDLVVGNLGLNNKYTASKEKPFKLYVNDFDQNGSHDIYLAFNQEGKSFPVRGKQCSTEQMPFVSEKFETYDEFGKSTVEEILKGREDGMVAKEAYTFESVIYFAEENGTFTLQSLPRITQVSPIYAIVTYDFDSDGDLDLFTAGNFYDREVETTRSDAGTGAILLNEGDRKWKYVSPTESGICANGDVRDAELILAKNAKPILAIANNNGPMQFYKLN